MAFRLAQISDTHLSPAHPEFTANFMVVSDHLRQSAPDLVINTGDVSAHGELGGAEAEADLTFAYRCHAGIGLDWLAVPGNHDVGNDPAVTARNGADAERVARWNGIFGADRFVRDVPGWRMIGLDSLITGTDLAEAQFAFLEEALRDAAGRRVAIFLHKPLCVNEMDEADLTYWCVLPAPRRRLLALLAAVPPSFVASGHVHQWRDRTAQAGLPQIWAPAVAFFVGDTWQHVVGKKTLGYVEHVLHEDGRHDYRLVEPERMQGHDIGLMPDVYGPQTPV
jgi:3',5'-cyclic AMP phosphodiesterase CpdA